MNNNYYILRHGNSEANREGIILSDFKLGSHGYGLTEKGREDIRLSVESLIASGELKSPVRIISSPFKRTKESALIAAKLLGVDDIAYNDDLRERFFGAFDQQPKIHYQEVWAKDLLNPEHNEWNVESVNQVFSRAYGIVDELEREFSGVTFILVTHGDTAQILQCGFKDIEPRLHRSLKTVEQGEWRRLG